MNGVAALENLDALSFRLPDAERNFLASDVYRQHAIPRGVYRPDTLEDVKAVVRSAVDAGLAVHVRGGGVSYTDAHLPKSADSIIIDTVNLDRIIDLNEKDMTVTVEPGISWQKLDAALAQRGLKVPFIGTFSGLAASVGGTLSQNANGHGSNANGISADSVIGIDILCADGEVIKTATSGAEAAQGRFRNFGPDITGLFLGDSGTLGIKLAITLKLLRRKTAHAMASFAFPSFEAMHAAMSAIAGMKVEEKSFGLDMALSQGQIAKQDAGSMLSVAKGVWASSPNAFTGLRSLIRMAAAGTKDLASAPFAAHYITDGYSQVEASAKIDAIRDVALRHGREIANSVPTVVQAMPFQPLHNMLGPAGERWVPLHGLLPHSRVDAFHAVFTAYVAAKRDEMASKKVHIGAMFSSIGASTFLYEPALYWQDAITEYHERMMEAGYLASLPRYPANPAGAALVEEMRTHIIGMMHNHGAGHFQVAKLYPLRDSLNGPTLGLVQAIKAYVDPNSRFNPGALGL